MKRTKLIFATVITLVAIITILQNTEAVETKLLFVTVTMPRALLLIVTLMTGFILGLLALSHLIGKGGEKNDRAGSS